MKINKKYFVIFIIIASLILIIGVYYIANLGDNIQYGKIKKEMKGVRISKDTQELIENVTVSINGSIDKSKDMFTFNGEVQLSNLEHSKGNNSLLVYSNGYGKDDLEKRGIISYVRNIVVNGKAVPDFAKVNWVNTDSKFSYLVLANYEDDCINSPYEDSIRIFQGNDIIVFPAEDAESAIKLIKEHQINQEIFLKTSLEDYGLN